MSAPRQSHMKKMKKLGKSLKGRPRLISTFRWQDMPGDYNHLHRFRLGALSEIGSLDERRHHMHRQPHREIVLEAAKGGGAELG